MTKWERHIAAHLYILLVSQANLKLHRNPIFKFGLKGSKVCSFMCAFISFDNLLMFLETVRS